MPSIFKTNKSFSRLLWLPDLPRLLYKLGLNACIRGFDVCPQDAIGQYDTIMQGNPDHQTGFNLVLCYYALEDGLSMKKAFQRLAAIPVQVIPLSLLCCTLVWYLQPFAGGVVSWP